MLLKDENLEQKNKLKNWASTASVSVSALLALLKIAAAIATGSLAILSSLIDSLADIFASSITWVAVRFSSRPATFDHRYGYGKVEAISALVQAAFIAGSGIFVLYDGIYRIFYPTEVEKAGIGMLVMAVSLVTTLGLIAFQKFVAKKTGSIAIAADSDHYTVDVVTNVSIIITLAVVDMFGFDWFDTLTASVVSIFLLVNAYKLAGRAISTLTDAELPVEVRKKVCEIVMSSPFAKGLHDLRTRDLGGAYMFEFHLELDGDLPLSAAHEMTEAVEENIWEEFPNAQIIIHQDPVGVDEERLDRKLVK